jgi:hypothetical protein
MALLGSKQHTENDTRRWVIKYGRWLDNTATIETIDVQSSSSTCTIDPAKTVVLGQDVVFFLVGGMLGETLTVTLRLTDSFDNVKTDTISFHVVAA